MKENHLKKVLNKQFKIAELELKYEDICNNQIPSWYKKYTCTEEQNQKWVQWTQKYLKEKLKMTKDRATIESAWINLNYGLKIKKSASSKKKK